MTVVAKALGELWKALSEEERAAYKVKAQQRAAGASLALAFAGCFPATNHFHCQLWYLASHHLGLLVE